MCVPSPPSLNGEILKSDGPLSAIRTSECTHFNVFRRTAVGPCQRGNVAFLCLALLSVCLHKFRIINSLPLWSALIAMTVRHALFFVGGRSGSATPPHCVASFSESLLMGECSDGQFWGFVLNKRTIHLHLSCLGYNKIFNRSVPVSVQKRSGCVQIFRFDPTRPIRRIQAFNDQRPAPHQGAGRVEM